LILDEQGEGKGKSVEKREERGMRYL